MKVYLLGVVDFSTAATVPFGIVSGYIVDLFSGYNLEFSARQMVSSDGLGHQGHRVISYDLTYIELK